MSFKRIIYSIIVIIITIFSVSIILEFHINTSKINVSYYTENNLKNNIETYIDTISRGTNSTEKELEKPIIPDKKDTQEKPKENTREENMEKENSTEKDILGKSINEKNVPQNLINKKNEIFSSLEYDKEYDKKTQDFLIHQLEEDIRKSKLNQFHNRLSQEKTIEDINISKIKNKLSSKDKNELQRIIDELGSINSLKLMKIIKDGMSPEEQQDMQNLLKNKLTEEDIILLNDILGKYIDE
ncbi:hypothetical protein GOQ29_10950 [Clostridium sp. D2Q-14]|uniref:hypothetical protein n=1 Tax=Anaeromonas gelatinilytica TaxID=2683194 RepID=UPI00193C61AB|nr:hypothetical protein [Anaeromonas gelatinilytica]MBS4536133.1 hypothetical protein [Anaeromonas gelatinilytica]